MGNFRVRPDSKENVRSDSQLPCRRAIAGRPPLPDTGTPVKITPVHHLGVEERACAFLPIRFRSAGKVGLLRKRRRVLDGLFRPTAGRNR
jgi:hypothetical protein